MNSENPKNKWNTVRIRQNVKDRLQRIARKKASLEDRVVTECELANKAISHYCNKEEKKLGAQHVEVQS